jgi:hypothetical protein
MNILEIDAALAAQDAIDAAARAARRPLNINKRHGGPYDRGSSDYYYCCLYAPHYYVGDTYSGQRITDLTAQERAEYEAGWDDAEALGDQKDWS